MKNSIKVSISQGTFTYSETLETNRDITYDKAVRLTLGTFLKGAIIDKIQFAGATYTRKDKDGNIVEKLAKRPKFSAPFTISITTNDGIDVFSRELKLSVPKDLKGLNSQMEKLGRIIAVSSIDSYHLESLVGLNSYATLKDQVYIDAEIEA